MKNAIGSRVGPAAGLLFFPLIMLGFSIHGYPDIRPTDARLAGWLAGVDQTTFGLGVYIEALGTVLLLPFAAWLFGQLGRGARESSWPAIAMLAAAAGWVTATLPINEAWVGIVDGARRGVDIHVSQTIVSINQAWFEMTGILFGLTLAAAGVAIIRGGAMSRWVGWAAVIIGVGTIASVPVGAAATPTQLLGFLWFLLIGGYYTIRPARKNEVERGASQTAAAGGLHATR